MDHDFTSDGCSVVPERDHKECCVRHDWLYWQGGTWRDRRRADREFRTCLRSTRYGWLAWIRWCGVRVGGTPLLRTPWRWGYGWRRWLQWAARDPDESPVTAASQQATFDALVAEAIEHDRIARGG